MKERYLHTAIADDALALKKMAFISGPRQVGKTTLGQAFLESVDRNYFSWDVSTFQRAWVKNPAGALVTRGPGPVLLDEIHKDRKWKSRLKGIYDTSPGEPSIIVTGSARLDVFRRGSDSLMGRYLPYRLHPFSVGERPKPPLPDEIFHKKKIKLSVGGSGEFRRFSRASVPSQRATRGKMEPLAPRPPGI